MKAKLITICGCSRIIKDMNVKARYVRIPILSNGVKYREFEFHHWEKDTNFYIERETKKVGKK